MYQSEDDQGRSDKVFGSKVASAIARSICQCNTEIKYHIRMASFWKQEMNDSEMEREHLKLAGEI